MKTFYHVAGLLGFYFTLTSLVMIPPSNVATLRTAQIVVAFVAQVIINNTIPEIIDVLGALFIFLAAVVVTFESQIYEGLVENCPCYCFRPHVRATIIETEEAINVPQDIRPQAPGRVRVASISLS